MKKIHIGRNSSWIEHSNKKNTLETGCFYVVNDPLTEEDIKFYRELEKEYVKKGYIKEGDHLEDFYVDPETGIRYLDRKKDKGD